MVRRILLVCGILSPVLYAVSDLVAGMQWEGYSFRDQTISELAAIDAPSRPLFVVLLLLVYGLMVAFKRRIRIAPVSTTNAMTVAITRSGSADWIM